MKKIIWILSSIVILAIFSITISSSSGGRASAASTGNTGAPGDDVQTCISCHNGGGSIAVNMEIIVTDANGSVITDYSPEQIYNVEVLINATAGTPLGYGFQLVSLADGNNANIAGWQNPESNVKLVATNGRNYAEHNDVTTNNSFKLEWKAPVSGSGSVTFYTSGNGVNKNSATSGDGASKTTLSLGEDGGPAASVDYIAFASPKVYPTQFTSNFAVENFIGNTEIYDLNGRLIQNVLVTSNNQIIDLSNQNTGLYILKFTNQEGQAFTKKVVKL